MQEPEEPEVPKRPLLAALVGVPIGMLGGLIGLGGAEFRLPVLKAAFGYPTRRAVSLNLAVSLLTLLAALGIRTRGHEPAAFGPMVPVLLGLAAGAMAGAWRGASYASRIPVARLERLILVLLIGIGLALIVEAGIAGEGAGLPYGLAVRLPVAVLLGAAIGVVSSLLGVAGGELLIPTLVFVFGADIKLAGTGSVLVSLPTVVVGCWRYARAEAFVGREDLSGLVVPMGVGSMVGALVGGLLVPYVSSAWMKVGLGCILIVSAVRIFQHRHGTGHVQTP